MNRTAREPSRARRTRRQRLDVRTRTRYVIWERRNGGVAEWLMAPVLKTGRGLRSLVGSNPTPSAKKLSATVVRNTATGIAPGKALPGPSPDWIARVQAAFCSSPIRCTHATASSTTACDRWTGPAINGHGRQSNKHYRKAHIALLVRRADICLSTQVDLIVISPKILSLEGRMVGFWPISHPTPEQLGWGFLTPISAVRSPIRHAG